MACGWASCEAGWLLPGVAGTNFVSRGWTARNRIVVARRRAASAQDRTARVFKPRLGPVMLMGDAACQIAIRGEMPAVWGGLSRIVAYFGR